MLEGGTSTEGHVTRACGMAMGLWELVFRLSDGVPSVRGGVSLAQLNHDLHGSNVGELYNGSYSGMPTPDVPKTVG